MLRIVYLQRPLFLNYSFAIELILTQYFMHLWAVGPFKSCNYEFKSKTKDGQTSPIVSPSFKYTH